MRLAKRTMKSMTFILLHLVILLIFFTSEIFAGSISFSSSAVNIGQTVTATWSGFSGEVNVEVWKGNYLWVNDAAIRQPSSGSWALNTAGWETRTDYRVGIRQRLDNTISMSDNFAAYPKPDLVAVKSYLTSVGSPGTELTTPKIGDEVNLRLQFRVDKEKVYSALNKKCYINGQIYDTSTESPVIGIGTYYTAAQTSYKITNGGTLTVRWLLDENNQITEGNETNNEVTAVYSIPDQIDLRVDVANNRDGNGNISNGYIGQPVYFRFDYSALGNGTTSPFTITCNVDGEPYWSTSMTATGGQSYSVTAPTSFAVTSPSHTITWTLDSANTISEPNENNNTASYGWTPISFSAPNPVLPANGATASDNTPDLTWQESSGNVNYFNVQIASDPGFSNIVSETANWGTSTYTPSALVNGTYWWRVRAHNTSNLWSDWSNVWSFNIGSSATPSLVPLYRLYKPGSTVHDHFYTAFEPEKNNAVNNLGYRLEKIEAYIYNAAFAGCVPIYRLYNSTAQVHYYATTVSEKDNARALGFVEEGITGYALPVPTQGTLNAQYTNTVPLYHLYHQTFKDHFYTVSEAERANAIKTYGFRDKGISLYVARNTQNVALAGKPVATDGGVDLSSGNFQPFYDHIDFANPAGRGIPFSFSRTYNAMNSATTGVLGPGWDHGYNITLVEDTTLGMAYVKWPNGQIDLYLANSGSYSPYCGNASPNCGIYNVLTKSGSSYFLTTKEMTKFTFDTDTSSGTIQLTKIEDRNGNPLSVSYDGNGNISTIIDGSGRSYIFTYFDFAARLGIDPSQFTDGSRYRLYFINEVIDNQYYRAIQFDYDNQGNLAHSWDAENHRTQYDYVSVAGLPLLTKVTLPKGNNWVANYDDQGKVKNVTVDSQFTQYSYGDPVKGTLVTSSSRDNPNIPLNISSCIHAGTNLKSCSNEKGETGEIVAWQDMVNPAQVKDKNGNIWTYAYNSKGNIRTATSPLTGTNPLETTTYDYDSSDLYVAKVTDPQDNVTRYEYYANGNLQNIINVDVVDGVSYDRVTHFTYYSTSDHPEWNGLVKTVTDPRNNVTTYQYDNLGYPASIKDAKGYTTILKYDVWGRLTERTDADGVKVTYTYDNNNRLKTITDMLGRMTAYTYDDNGNIDNVYELARGIKKQYSYRANSDLLESIQNINTSTNATKLLVKYDYDPLSRIKSITNGRLNSWLTSYDNSTSNISQVTTPVSSIFDRFTLYDGNGNLKTQVDRSSRTIQSGYDNSNRLTSKVVGTSGQYAYSYFLNGLLKNVTSPQGRSSVFDYTTRSQIKSSTDPFNKTVNYGYDETGNLKNIVYPDGKTVIYNYNEQNLLQSVKDINEKTTQYEYTPAGRLSKITYPNNAYIEYLYDSYGRLKTVNNKKADGSIIQGSTVDVFDALDAPKQVTTTGGVQPVITSSDSGETIYDDNNRLSSAPNASFTNNSFGELTSKASNGASTTYTWDSNDLPGRLIAVDSDSLNIHNSYKYDGLGNRIEATRNGSTTRYVLDLSGSMSKIIAETTPIASTTAYYVHGLGLIARILPNGSYRYYHYDRMGNTIALTDESGNVTDQYSYEGDPYGNNVASQGASYNPFRFVGQFGVMDEGSNLYFMRARYYDAQYGRFLNEDPIGFEGGNLNKYGYVDSNPLVNADPNGLKGAPIIENISIKVEEVAGLVADYYKASIWRNNSPNFLSSARAGKFKALESKARLVNDAISLSKAIKAPFDLFFCGIYGVKPDLTPKEAFSLSWDLIKILASMMGAEAAREGMEQVNTSINYASYAYNLWQLERAAWTSLKRLLASTNSGK